MTRSSPVGAVVDPPAATGPKSSPLLEVAEIVRAAEPPAGLMDHRLEGPAPGTRVAARGYKLAGWVLPRSGRVLAVEVTHDGRLLQTARTGLDRPDVAAAYPQVQGAEAAGFEVALNLLAVRNEIELNVRAVLEDDDRPQIGSVRLVRISSDDDSPGPPLVSVVIPCFNQAHYLGEAIESVLAQSHPNFEIIVVDDGSLDNSAEVAGRYPGVRYIHQQNRGPAAARNAGLAESQGAMVVCLDADDRLRPDAIEIGLQALEDHHGAALVAGASRDIDAGGDEVRSRRQPVVTREHYLSLLEDCFIWSGASVVYRRSVLEAVGGFNEARRAGDDYELYLRIARRFPLHCHDAVIADYRRHAANMTRDARLILVAEISVLRSQRRALRTPRERAAYRTGIRRTRKFHGERLAAQVGHDLRSGSLGHACRGCLTLARWHPRGLLSAIGISLPQAHRLDGAGAARRAR